MNSKSDCDSGSAAAGGDCASADSTKSGGFSPLAVVRELIAGLLMGIANLIPGVSGGTMILAMGIYEEFIDAVANMTALRFTWRRIVFLGAVGGAAAVAIVGLAGVILYLLFHYTVAMFALFIGLTLGGAPLLLRMIKPVRGDVVASVLVGIGLMVGVFCLKGGVGFPHNTGMDFVSGVVGSTTMVLPGISGSYMLLVMDQYDRVVGSVRDFKEGLSRRDAQAIKSALWIVIPVGLGAILGIVILSNVLKMLLRNYHRVTVGLLLGILLGSVLGLWPFSQAVGEKALEGRSLEEVRSYAERWSIPDAGRYDDKEGLIGYITTREVWAKRVAPPIRRSDVGLALGLALVGFAATGVLSRLGGGEPGERASASAGRSADE